MNSETDSNHKEWTPGDTKKYEEQIAALNGSLNDYTVEPLIVATLGDPA